VLEQGSHNKKVEKGIFKAVERAKKKTPALKDLDRSVNYSYERQTKAISANRRAGQKKKRARESQAYMKPVETPSQKGK